MFYTVHLTAPEVFYFDTFGSDFDTVIRILRGSACTGGAAPMGTHCRNDAVQHRADAVMRPACRPATAASSSMASTARRPATR